MVFKISNTIFSTNTWNIVSDYYTKKQAITDGSNFMIGNGYLGYRGTFSDDRKDAYVGCIVTDTWDNADNKWEELVNVPNALFTRFEVNSRKLNMDRNYSNYSRELDLKHGITKRMVTFDVDGTSVQYKESKFAHIKEKNIIIMTIELLADQDSKLLIDTGVDTDVWSINGNHFKEVDGFINDGKYGVKVVTNTYDDEIIVLEKHDLQEKVNQITEDGLYVNQYLISLKRNKPFVFTKYMIVTHSNNEINPYKKALDIYQNMAPYEMLVESHKKEWETIWNDIDVAIDGEAVDQVGFRFNTYHAFISTPTHKPLPIGARGLSCQAYQGAAFWDQEIFNTPMFLYTKPDIAKSILTYRYETLAGAKRKAQKHGYEGAFYAWISGKTGDELCPDFFFKDVITKRNIRNHFNLWQIHISPDIAYTVDKYYQVTNDIAFIEKKGAEMVFEIARFIASRVDYKPRRKQYEIIRVQGPDEYHENVDNNLFTNVQSKFAIDIALKYLNDLDSTIIEKIRTKIDLTKEEVDLWQDISNRLYIPKANDNGLLEQFDGYFDLESIVPANKITERLIDPEEYYGWPNGIAVFTQVLKQADTVQLFHLHPELYSDEIVKTNYEYYEPRTLHFSSLSPSIHSIVASQIGLTDQSYHYFKKSLMIDLLNTNEAVSGGTFIGGMHTAANAAAWQMVVIGFGGFHYSNNTFYISPKLPSKWDNISFKLILRGHPYHFKLSNHKVIINNIDLVTPEFKLKVFNQDVVLNEAENTFIKE